MPNSTNEIANLATVRQRKVSYKAHYQKIQWKADTEDAG